MTGPLDIGSQRELFVDQHLIDALRGVELRLAQPQPTNVALRHDQPWEGRYTLYTTVLQDGDLYRMYYRGWPDPTAPAVTCYAESRDGITFTKPELGLCEFNGSTRNNIILFGKERGEQCVEHNFCPMLDPRPDVPAAERFKAFGGGWKSGVFALASADGVRWRRLSDQPLFTATSLTFDSQNVPFWSATEGCYVFYHRTWLPSPDGKPKKIRWISRSTSPDFRHWSAPVAMETGNAPIEQFYTNQTHPYFRAPHLYIGLAARFWLGRRVLTDADAATVDMPPKYFNDCSDAVLLTSRGGHRYDRTFLESFIRPGPGAGNWTSRTNYPALGVVPTGATEMSLYVGRHYTQPTNFTERCTLRTDGFASIHAPYAGGELLTKPFRFTGAQLTLNFATSAAGSIRVEIQDAGGVKLAESNEIIGDRIDYPVCGVTALQDRPIRLRFVMKDADLYSFQFQ